MANLLEQRVEILMRRVKRAHPEAREPFFVAVLCDGCGALRAADSAQDLLPKIDGWSLDGTRACIDLCPECIRVD